LPNDDDEREIWLRRQAALIVTMLPEKSCDAIKTLEYASLFMRAFIIQKVLVEKSGVKIVRLVPNPDSDSPQRDEAL
jgi:hypothetical protein